MKTKLLVLFTAILTLGSLSSCIAPYGYGGYGYGRSYYSGGYHRGYSGGYGGRGYGGGYSHHGGRGYNHGGGHHH